MKKDSLPIIFKGGSNYLLFILLLGIVSIGISLGVVLGTFLRSLNIDGIRDLYSASDYIPVFGN